MLTAMPSLPRQATIKPTLAPDQLAALARAVEAPRVKLFRRMNMAPDATAVLVKMRGALLSLLPEHPELRASILI